MNFEDVTVPAVYTTESADFRFFLKWFANALAHLKYDHEHFLDLYDPQKCPSKLLWMLADTMGYKYDNRVPIAFNRYVMLYFQSLIRNRGSRNGVTLAAEVNLKQYDIQTVAGDGYYDKDGNFVEPKPELYERIEDTSLPTNSVYVNFYADKGYIDVVYFSDRNPVDATMEYVRPLGMYCFSHAGVVLNARTRLAVDARLTDSRDLGLSIGPTHVGHYSREDYARLQRINASDLDTSQLPTLPAYSPKIKDGITQSWNDDRTQRRSVEELTHKRRNVWYRNSDYEGSKTPIQAKERNLNPGYRALYSLQLANNEHVTKSLIPYRPGQPNDKTQIFGLGWQPQDVTVTYPSDYKLPDEEADWTGFQYPYDREHGQRTRAWNLRYDKATEENISDEISTVDSGSDILHPVPMIAPVMHTVGDAVDIKPDDPNNTEFTAEDNSQGLAIYKYNQEYKGAKTTSPHTDIHDD